MPMQIAQWELKRTVSVGLDTTLNYRAQAYKMLLSIED
jgi:hypothetical protein